ncbi:MAG: hypothetical protein ACYTXP_38815 [Nostoc sp.]
MFNFNLILSMAYAIVLIIKITFYCFAIWGLLHYHWLDAIALVLIGEFLGYTGKVTIALFEID